MARIRSVHPGLFTDEAFVSVSMPARMLAIGLWTECDDQGAFEWKPITLKMRILPADHVDVAALMEELAGANLIRAYESGGKRYGLVRNFCRFQRPKKPNAVYPVPAELRIYAGGQIGGVADDASGGVAGNPSPPVPNSAIDKGGAVGNQFPTGGEIVPQMEDGGWRMKEEKEGESVAPASPPPDSVAPGGEDRRRKVGQRIPAGWQPDQAGIAFARSEGLDPGRVLERFRDYWAGKAGQAACKTDWPATWRNWCREDADRKKPMGQFNRPAMTPAQQSSVEIMDFVRRMSGTGPEPQPPQYDFDVGLSS